jgi:hypothetical protein
MQTIIKEIEVIINFRIKCHLNTYKNNKSLAKKVINFNLFLFLRDTTPEDGKLATANEHY